jgi:hypothetical protein
MKVAFGLFGFIRTYENTYRKLNKSLDNINADLYIHTWDYTDNLNSWHGLNSRPQKTEKYLEKIKSFYHRHLVEISITSQDSSLNSLVYSDYMGRTGVVGHQYHMWLSVLNVLKMAYEKNNYDFVVISRPDLKIKFPKEVLANCQKNKFNFIFKYIDKNASFSINNITVYDLLFIVDKSFIVVVEKLLDNIINTNSIISQKNYLFNFFNEIEYEINPIIDENIKFEIVRPRKSITIKFLKKIFHLFKNHFNV